MRSAVLVAPRRFDVREVRRPEPGRGQVRVRLEGCGVCGSNLPVWQGRPWFEYPRPAGQPGHEAWGRIEAVGPGVSSVAVGDRVAGLTESGFAEAALFDEAGLVPLPASLDRVDVPGEPLACVMNVMARSDIRAGHTVAVVGIGFLGAALVQLAAAAGARVIAISRRRHAREVARAMGAWRTFPIDEAGLEEQVHQLTGGGCDRVIEVVGLQEPLDLAARLTRVRGRLIIAGFHQDGPRQVDMFLWNWRGLDVINAHERDRAAYVDGMRRATSALTSGRLDPTPLYSRVPLARIEDAFQALEGRPDGFVKALITM
ncbi:MAG TPA: zinc-binding dehydrogenase [Kofleriaceae bacterium]|nr:zinc-binding dehydrogenase [Kofleriaceae bacterium]